MLSLVLYGGAAKGEYVPGRSDLNLMIVVRDASSSVLDLAAPVLRRGEALLGIEPFLLSEEDLRNSTDVFPGKFLDIQRHHRVLLGQDLLTGLVISREHLRLRCEQELRNLVLRLRQIYLRYSQRPEQLADVLVGSLTSLLVNVATLAELREGCISTTKSEAVEAAGRLGIETAPLRRLMEMKQGGTGGTNEELKALYCGLLRAGDQAVRLIDET